MRPWQLILLIAVTFVLGVGIGWQPFWVLTYALLGALVLSVVWLALSVRGITFARSALGGRAQVGERVEESLTLENHSVIPKLWIQVSDGSTLPGHHAGYVSSVGPHQRIAWRAKTVCRRRGRFTLGPVTATTGDPLGLFRRELVLAPEHQLLVLPPTLPLSHFELVPGLMPGRGRGSQRSLQTTTNVVTVRNYVPGDALTRIHWPSTARLSQFMVKEFDLDPTIDVVLMLDLDREAQAGEGDSSTEEYGVTMAASIAAYLLRQQELSVGLHVNGTRGVGLGAGSRRAPARSGARAACGGACHAAFLAGRGACRAGDAPGAQHGAGRYHAFDRTGLAAGATSSAAARCATTGHPDGSTVVR